MDFLIYLICLGVGFVFTLGTAVFGHVFGGHGHVDGSGGHAEAGVESSDMPGVSAFSPTVIASFVTAFGGFGIIFHYIAATRKPVIRAPLALACGFATAGGLLWDAPPLLSPTPSPIP